MKDAAMESRISVLEQKTMDHDRQHISFEERFARSDERFDRMMTRSDEKFEQLLARLDQKFDRIDKRFEKVDERFEKMEERFYNLQIDIGRRFDDMHRQIILQTRWYVITVLGGGSFFTVMFPIVKKLLDLYL